MYYYTLKYRDIKLTQSGCKHLHFLSHFCLAKAVWWKNRKKGWAGVTRSEEDSFALLGTGLAILRCERSVAISNNHITEESEALIRVAFDSPGQKQRVFEPYRLSPRASLTKESKML